MLVSVLILLLCDTIFGYSVDSKPYYDLDKVNDYFEEFIINFKKTYANEEEKEKRLELFKNVLIEINELNSISEHTVFGITQFSDLTTEEFEKFYTGFKTGELPDNNECVKFIDDDVKTKTAPEYRFDWIEHNVVTEVKNQLNCGSCWAFAATGVVEAQYALKYKQPVSLSPQQVVDCDILSGKCGGGLPLQALDFLIHEGGQLSEADYPYTGTEGICKFDNNKVIAEVAQCFEYALEDEAKLKEVLYTQGPLAIGIEFSHNLSHAYHGGIVEHYKHCGDSVNHAVLLVGYGITDKGKKYWIIKNSYGPIWGENGYFRLEMGTNTCGMMLIPSASATVS